MLSINAQIQCTRLKRNKALLLSFNRHAHLANYYKVLLEMGKWLRLMLCSSIWIEFLRFFYVCHSPVRLPMAPKMLEKKRKGIQDNQEPNHDQKRVAQVADFYKKSTPLPIKREIE